MYDLVILFANMVVCMCTYKIYRESINTESASDRLDMIDTKLDMIDTKLEEICHRLHDINDVLVKVWKNTEQDELLIAEYAEDRESSDDDDAPYDLGRILRRQPYNLRRVIRRPQRYPR